MSPTGFEPVTPPLKVECSKTNWATKTLSKWQGSNLRPESPKLPALPNWATPRYCWGRVRCRSPYLSVPTVFKTVSQAVVITLPLFSPKGSNLDSVDQNHVSCQVRRGENYEANMSKNFFFLFEVPIRFELMTPGYKAGILPNYTKEPNFWV